MLIGGGAVFLFFCSPHIVRIFPNHIQYVYCKCYLISYSLLQILILIKKKRKTFDKMYKIKRTRVPNLDGGEGKSRQSSGVGLVSKKKKKKFLVSILNRL